MKKILFICGSVNQTMMMHQISQYFKDFDCYFTPYYADGFIDKMATAGLLDFSILGNKRTKEALNYLNKFNLTLDISGSSNDYEMVFTCSDLVIQKNVKNKKLILVQEGMTNPRNLGFYLVKWFNLPGYMGDTATTGLSDFYDIFCVASEGYKELFISNGVNPDKIIVTGIPNYDNCSKYYENDFPYKNYVLAATSDARETFMYENRKKFIENVVKIANGKQIIFKLHPNEQFDRAINEIEKFAPGALVYTSGNVHEMIANCDTLITRYSTVVYTGIALGKEVYSFFDINKLHRLAPIQNGGTSALNIASEARKLLYDEDYYKIIKNKNKILNRFKQYSITDKIKYNSIINVFENIKLYNIKENNDKSNIMDSLS